MTIFNCKNDQVIVDGRAMKFEFRSKLARAIYLSAYIEHDSKYFLAATNTCSEYTKTDCYLQCMFVLSCSVLLVNDDINLHA